MSKPGAGDGITEASVVMQDHIGQPIGGEDLHTDGVVSETPPAPDIFGLTEIDKKIFGLKENETYIAIRDPGSEEWKRTDPGRFRQIQNQYGGNARMLKDADGNIARPLLPGLNDMVFVAVPKVLHEAFEANQQREIEAYMREGDPEHGRKGSFDQRQRDHIEQAAQESHERLAAIADENGIPMRLSQGIIGNTSGMSIEQAMSIIPREMREEEAKRYRQGARYEGLTDEQFGSVLAGAPPEKAKGKTYGVGRGLGNENPNSALAQARNARARDGQPRSTR